MDGDYSKKNYHLNRVILVVSLIIMVGNIVNAGRVLGWW